MKFENIEKLEIFQSKKNKENQNNNEDQDPDYDDEAIDIQEEDIEKEAENQ